jgi:hypothetical protein
MKEIDYSLVENFFNLVHVNGFCLEVRCFDAVVASGSHWITRSREKYTVAGWFTSYAELRCEISRIQNVSCYISVNPVKISRRPLRAKNSLKILKQGEFVLDSDIDLIRFIIVDIDPIRLPSQNKINSTNQELFECICVRDKIIEDFDIKDKAVYGISGNGAFILIDVTEYNFPNTGETRTKIDKFIRYLSEKYKNKYCIVDTNSSNPSRMIGIPGTWKYKNEFSTPDRPHRKLDIHGLGGNDGISVKTPVVVQS